MGLFFEDDEKEKAKISKHDEKAILKLAKAKHGKLTVSEVALGTSLSLDEADNALKYFVLGGYANMEVTDNGVIIYVFHGFSAAKEYEKTDYSFPSATNPPRPGSRPSSKSIKPYTRDEEIPHKEKTDTSLPPLNLPPMAKPGSRPSPDPVKPYIPEDEKPDEDNIPENANQTDDTSLPPLNLPPMAKPGTRPIPDPVKPYIPEDEKSDEDNIPENADQTKDSRLPPLNLPPMAKPGSRPNPEPIKPYIPEDEEKSHVAKESAAEEKSAEVPDWLKNRRKKNWED